MPGFYDANTISAISGEALEMYRFVKFSSSTVVYADALDEDFIGVTLRKVGSGEYVPIKVINAAGTFPAVAAGTFSANAILYLADDGKVDDSTGGGSIKVGIAGKAATTAGDVVTVLLTPWSQIVDTTVTSLTAGENLAVNRLVKLSGGKAVYADAADADFIGWTTAAALNNAAVQVKLINAPGLHTGVATAAFATHALLYVANDGKVDDSGTYAIGYALTAAADADVTVTYLPQPWAEPIDNTIVTFTAGEALAIHRNVKLSGGKAVYADDTDEDFVGYTLAAADNDASVRVKLANSPGLHTGISAAAYSAHALLYLAADGKVDDSGTIAIGVAYDAAGAGDATVTYIPTPWPELMLKTDA